VEWAANFFFAADVHGAEIVSVELNGAQAALTRVEFVRMQLSWFSTEHRARSTSLPSMSRPRTLPDESHSKFENVTGLRSNLWSSKVLGASSLLRLCCADSGWVVDAR